MTFNEAFAAARRAGRQTFTWNGKSYTTELAGEGGGRTRPRARPQGANAGKPTTARSPDARGSAIAGPTPAGKTASSSRVRPQALPSRGSRGPAGGPAPRPVGRGNPTAGMTFGSARPAPVPANETATERRRRISREQSRIRSRQR